MAKQVSKGKSRSEKTEAPVESKKSESAEQVKKSTDDMLDKIDDLLKDVKAEEFINQFIQKPGE